MGCSQGAKCTHRLCKLRSQVCECQDSRSALTQQGWVTWEFTHPWGSVECLGAVWHLAGPSLLT